MYRLHIYLTEDINNKLDIKAKVTGKTKAEIARKALEEGLRKTQVVKSNSAGALLELADMAEDLSSEVDSPRDLSKNHDYYTWGEDKSE